MEDPSCFVPEIPMSFQKSYFLFTRWLSIPTMLLGIWCFVSNATVIIALFRSGIKSVRPGLLILCSLSFADLIWGAAVAPMESALRLKHLFNTNVCELYSEWRKTPLLFLTEILFNATVLNLCIVSIDRFLAIKVSFQYKVWVTQRRALFACILVWLASILLSCLSKVGFISSNVTHVITLTLIPLALSVVIILQIKSIHVLRRHNNNIAGMIQQGNQANPANSVNAVIERKLTKTAIYVVGILSLVFIPAAFAIMITIITKKRVLSLVVPLFTPLMTLCSGINPVLYYRGNERVKRGIAKFLKYKCH